MDEDKFVEVDVSSENELPPTKETSEDVEITTEQPSEDKTEEVIEEDPIQLLRRELTELAENNPIELVERYINLYQELEETKKLRDEYLDTAQRVQASFENYKKQIDKNIQYNTLHNKSKILRQFLSVFDDLERTKQLFAVHPDVEKAKEALEMIYRNLRSVMEDLGLKIIEPSKERFDPKYHEAIHVVETDEEEDQTIIEVVAKGFQLENTIIRPAKVVVTKKPAKKGSKKDSSQDNKN